MSVVGLTTLRGVSVGCLNFQEVGESSLWILPEREARAGAK